MLIEVSVLFIASASIAFFHTILGPDHYLPFIVMSRSGKWSLKKTTLVTFFCGLAHILSSVILGIIGIVLGIAIFKLESFEAFRGNLAGWSLLVFGFIYTLWGIHRAIKNKKHVHKHEHADGSAHDHEHNHMNSHMHVHEKKEKNVTPWVLFLIFLFGPCEPLIPLLMYPAAKISVSGLILVIVTFGTVTIMTMLGIVLISSYGINFIKIKKIERYSHAIAGFTVLLSGVSIQFLGL